MKPAHLRAASFILSATALAVGMALSFGFGAALILLGAIGLLISLGARQ